MGQGRRALLASAAIKSPPKGFLMPNKQLANLLHGLDLLGSRALMAAIAAKGFVAREVLAKKGLADIVNQDGGLT